MNLHTQRGQAAFEKLIFPISTNEFFSKYWGKQYLHISRNDPDYHHDVLTFPDVDSYLERNDLRYPYIRLVKEGGELPLANYAHDMVFGENLFQGNLDTDAIFREYADGATLCMQLQQLAMPTLATFTRLVESYFGYRTQSTIFLTPSNSHGFTRHFDSHDFFTMGIKGEKTWRLYAEKAEYPLPRTEVIDSQVEISDEIEGEIVVKSGDTLYVPRGVYHDARSENRTSMQISLGVFPYYWCDVLHTLIDELADKHAKLRMAVVPTKQIDRSALHSDFLNLLRLIENADIADVVTRLQALSSSKRVKEMSNRLHDLESLGQLSHDSVLKARDIDIEITDDSEVLNIVFYDKRITLPNFVRPQIDAILSGAPFSAETLPESLDISGRMLLIRKLLTEGLITFLPRSAGCSDAH